MTDDAVRFGQFRFDLRRRELFRDESSVRLGGRAPDVLHALGAAKGDVVSKTELLTRGQGMAVGENNLQVQISLLRKTLQEGTSGESYVVTVPGRGYRPQPPIASYRYCCKTILRPGQVSGRVTKFTQSPPKRDIILLIKG